MPGTAGEGRTLPTSIVEIWHAQRARSFALSPIVETVDTGTEERTADHLLTRLINNLAMYRVYAAPMAAHALLNRLHESYQPAGHPGRIVRHTARRPQPAAAAAGAAAAGPSDACAAAAGPSDACAVEAGLGDGLGDASGDAAPRRWGTASAAMELIRAKAAANPAQVVPTSAAAPPAAPPGLRLPAIGRAHTPPPEGDADRRIVDWLVASDQRDPPRSGEADEDPEAEDPELERILRSGKEVHGSRDPPPRAQSEASEEPDAYGSNYGAGSVRESIQSFAAAGAPPSAERS